MANCVRLRKLRRTSATKIYREKSRMKIVLRKSRVASSDDYSRHKFNL